MPDIGTELGELPRTAKTASEQLTSNAIGEVRCIKYGEARSELIGKGVVLIDGKAGTVENVWLHELHGNGIPIKDHDGRWPVLTIKFTANWTLVSGHRCPKRTAC